MRRKMNKITFAIALCGVLATMTESAAAATPWQMQRTSAVENIFEHHGQANSAEKANAEKIHKLLGKLFDGEDARHSKSFPDVHEIFRNNFWEQDHHGFTKGDSWKKFKFKWGKDGDNWEWDGHEHHRG
jgi:hypothetical protein